MFHRYYFHALFAAFACHIPAIEAHEPAPHSHGIATLQVAVDNDNLTLLLSSPLQNLIGFEHQARNDDERDAIARMIDTFNHAEQLFTPSAEAACTVNSVQMTSAVVDRPATIGTANDESGHHDIDGTFVFHCQQADQLHNLHVRLFDHYPGLQRLNVEIISAHNQHAMILTPAQPTASWPLP